ncbi:MAG: peptide-methionine (S)-S-oxide reductase MsrA [Thermoleophilaceae bacterium]
MAKATFGAGCFWQVEIEFRNTPGVRNALVGYEGGTLENPSYGDVCTGRTGHAEVVEVEYEPDEVSYEDLVEKFFGLHNPTQKNRQGWDVGTQYRSAIFVHDEGQREAAERVKERAQANHRKTVQTRIEPASTFYKAEDYHQRYLEKRGLATCAV